MAKRIFPRSGLIIGGLLLATCAVQAQPKRDPAAMMEAARKLVRIENRPDVPGAKRPASDGREVRAEIDPVTGQLRQGPATQLPGDRTGAAAEPPEVIETPNGQKVVLGPAGRRELRVYRSFEGPNALRFTCGPPPAAGGSAMPGMELLNANR